MRCTTTWGGSRTTGRPVVRLLAALLAAGLLVGGCTATDPPTPQPQPTGAPPVPQRDDPATLTGAPGLSARIEAFLGASRWGRYDRVTAVLVSVDGLEVAEWHRPDLPESPREVSGVSAAVLVALVGILLERGELGVDGLAGVRQPLERLLPAPLPEPLAGAGGTALHELLIGTSVGDTVALSAMLTAATGRPVPELARELLFEPLGIDPPWTGAGPAVTSRDMARLGALWLQRGAVDGRQLVPAAWIDNSTRPYAETGRRRLPYAGYRQWVTRAEGHTATVFTGEDGQLVEVVPGLDLVVVVAAAEDPDPEVAIPASSEAFVELVDSVIVPGLG